MNQDGIFERGVRIGSLALSLIGLVGQYLARDQIEELFGGGFGSSFDTFSFGASILGVLILLTIFKYRFTLGFNRYLNRKASHQYSLDLAKQNTKEEYIQEPWSYTIDGIAAWMIIVDAMLFTFVVLLNQPILKGVCYFLFILIFVFITGTFLTQWYNRFESKKLERDAVEFATEKIESYFLPKITYIAIAKNYQSNPAVFEIVFKIEDKHYEVKVARYDPEGYFVLQELDNTVAEANG